MTAQQSLNLIAETLNKSRRSILRNSSKYFLLWGGVLAAISLAVYLLWHFTGNAAWNFLWFAMPFVGYPLACLLGKKDVDAPASSLGTIVGKVWAVFGAFSITLSAIAVCWVPMHITLLIVILLGLAESVSGVLLKNWPIIISGFIFGIGGAVIASVYKTDAQILIFTLGGILLAVTGLIVKNQYK